MREIGLRKLFPSFLMSPPSLRTKFIAVIVLIQFVLMGLVTVYIERRQRQLILNESRKRALSLATNFAALSEGYLLSYNFIKLEQTAEQVAAEDDVAYTIIQLYNGQVAAYSGRSNKQGKTLDDVVSQRALRAERPFLQHIATTELGGKGYDVAIPVFARGGTRKWGTVRLGFSLSGAMYEIRATFKRLVLLGIMAILLGTAGAIFLATRISRPIQQLVTGVNEVTKGNYQYSITVPSHDEVGYLAQRFEEMREALRLHVTYLAEEKRRLEWTNRTLRDTQEQLIQNEKLAAVGKLAARVAHEVNNPLAIIKTSFHILNDKILDGDPHREDMLIIEEEIDRIARIIKQLLDFARHHSDVTALQVNDVIHNLIKFVEPELRDHHIHIVAELSPELPVIRISPDHLKQVLLNLIKNAREAMPTGGTMRIQTAIRPSGVTISVIDTGVGIPANHLASIFEPFFSTKQGSEGVGLGLAVSSNIVKSYGGSIEVESQPEAGTVFHVCLVEHPLNAMRAHVSEPESPSEVQKELHPWLQEAS